MIPDRSWNRTPSSSHRQAHRLGVLLGTPWVAWMFSEMGEYSGLELPSAWTAAAAFLPGVGVMISVALFACTAPTIGVLRTEPGEVLKNAVGEIVRLN